MSRERWWSAVDVRHSAGTLLEALSSASVSNSLVPHYRDTNSSTINRSLPGDATTSPPPTCACRSGCGWKRFRTSEPSWLTRGGACAAGVGAFMRVNDRSYLAAYETSRGAISRLESTGRGAHLGLVGEGQSDLLATTKRDVTAALAERFPEASLSLEGIDLGRVASTRFGWAPLPDGRDDRTQQRASTTTSPPWCHQAPAAGGRPGSPSTAHNGKDHSRPTKRRLGPLPDGMARGALMELAATARTAPTTW